MYDPILLVGAGPMAVAYAKALQHLDVSFVVAGRGQASAEEFAAQTGIAAGTGLLADQVRALSGWPAFAIVAVGVLDLAPVAAELLGLGLQKLLVEKPGAVTPEAACALAEADRDGRIRIAYNRRFFASAARARQIIAEDGGVQSFHFEFTEIPARVEQIGHRPDVLENWAIANSSHVMDLAFHLAGAPEDLSNVGIAGTVSAGEIGWHSPGSRFAACGTVNGSTTFSCGADWGSGGGWAAEFCTARRRLRMRPLEQLTQQLTGTFTVEAVECKPEAVGIKAGLVGMLGAFLDPNSPHLCSSRDQARRIAVFDRLVRGERWRG